MVTSKFSNNLFNLGTSTPTEKMDRLSPVNGLKLFETPLSGQSDIDLLFANISSQGSKFQDLGVVNAARILISVCNRLQQRKDEINEAVFFETGKPESLIEGEFETAVNFMIGLAGLAQFRNGQVIPSINPRKVIYSRYQPYGTAALITSHNTPVPNYAWKLAPSFLSLNSSILKPSELTSLSAQRFVEAFLECAPPEFMVNLVHGGPQTVNSLLTKQPELVSFTGSFQTGLTIKNLTKDYAPKLILEMGGSNPIIVCKSANLEKAARAIVESAFSNSGQRCASGRRLIMHSETKSELLENIRVVLREFTARQSNGSFSGILVNERARAIHMGLIDYFQRSGAEVHLFAPQNNASNGEYVEAALVVFPRESRFRISDEIFSPILIAEEFENIDDALVRANDSQFALTASIWTEEIDEGLHLSSYVKAGIVNINGPTHGAEFQIPFGGQKNSGNGAKEVGMNCLTEYSFEKVVSFTQSEL
jgi:acyl-CoA reductase-like NAD-dependent aldehyde dehydrogenase